MTGGSGAAELAFGDESSFKSLSGTPNWTAFGRDERVDSGPTLDNQLQRMRDAGQVEAAESIAGNAEGAITISAKVSNDTQGDVESRIVFNGNGAFTNGAANTVTIAAGIDYLSGTAERELSGCIPLSYEVSYRQGDPVEHTLTMAYASETLNASLSPSGITQASNGSVAAFHGTDLSLSSSSVTKLQSATLSVDNIARYHRGTDREPVDATAAAPTTTLTTEAIYNEETYLEYALGSSGATTVEDSIAAQSGTLTLDTAGGTNISTYSLSRVKPRNYEWADLVGSSDMTEPITFDVNGGVTV